MVQTRSGTKIGPPILEGRITKRRKSAGVLVVNRKLKKLLGEELKKQRESKLSVSNVNKSVVIKKKNVKPPLDKSQTRRGVTALYELIEKLKTKSALELFNEVQPIFLQVTCVKVPQTPIRLVRFKLKHTLLTDSHEICLIVSDCGKNHDTAIEYYENLLSEKGITNIKTIMPFGQMRDEYGKQFELKRKLLGLYDYFLVDSRVCGIVTHLLGSIFFESRKMPTVVKMYHHDLKKHFETSLKKTIIKIHSKGDSYAVQIGHTGMSQQHLFENICGIVDDFQVLFPGGFNNVRALGIKTADSFLIPIYLTLKNRRKVHIPVCKPKLPKHYEDVEGELSTRDDVIVVLSPGGDVKVQQKVVKKTTKKVENKKNIKKVSYDSKVKKSSKKKRNAKK